MAPTSLRWRRRVAAVAVLTAVVSPCVRNADSFPLSTYPMYAGTRGRDVSISTAVGVDANGSALPLSLRAIAATDDPLIAESSVDGAIAAGRAGALCAEIAARASNAADVIEVVEERHDVVDRATGNASLLDRTVHARCEVP